MIHKMMRRLPDFVRFCIIMIFLIGGSGEGAAQTLNVGIHELHPSCRKGDWKPTEDVGLFPNLLNHIARKQGWRINYLSGSLQDLNDKLKTGEIDLMAPASYDQKAALDCRFGKESVVSTWARLFCGRGVQVDTILDLAGHSIGVLYDDPYNAQTRSMISSFGLDSQLFEFKCYDELIKALETGWVDIAVIDRIAAHNYQSNHRIIKTPIVLFPLELRFAASKTSGLDTLAIIDYHLRDLKNDPDSIYHQILKTTFDRSADNSVLLGRLKWISGLILLIAVFAILTSLFYKQRVLKKTMEIRNKNDELKREIDARHKLEMAMKHSNLLYEKTLASMRDGLLLIDENANRILRSNVAAAAIFGFKPDEMPNVLPDRLHADSGKAEAFYQQIQQAVLKKGYFSGRWELMRRGNQSFPAELTVTPFQLEETLHESSWVVIIRDITEKVDSENALQQSKMQLVQARNLEAIGTLAGGVAHDFNNLLMGIQGRTSLMMLSCKSSDPYHKHLKGIEECVNNASQLTRQLLGLARGGKYEVKATDLNELLSSTLEMFGRTKKEIRIFTDYGDEIWPVNVDRGQISQVFLNLFVNAWQAMPRGGDLHIKTENMDLVAKQMKILNLQPGKYVRVSVTDTGVGMDKSIQERIFEPFFTTKEKSRGTGLGLASAYGIIKNHNGLITVDSEKGRGSTFHLYLPAGGQAVVREKPTDEKIQNGNETILLVDDEDIVIDIGKELLEELGYTVLIAKNGHDAVTIYQTHQHAVDLVIFDMIMPGMNGGELYDRLKMLNPGVSTILSSGYSIDGQAESIMQKGCDGFIQKPFNLPQIAGKIKEIIENKIVEGEALN
jgi:PAS domain S-box-containing protein